MLQKAFSHNTSLITHSRLSVCSATFSHESFNPTCQAGPLWSLWCDLGCNVIALYLNSTWGQRYINMSRVCDCSWLLASDMLITRLHRLPSKRAYQGVQLFPSATVTGNKGCGTFTECGESAADGNEQRWCTIISQNPLHTTAVHQGNWELNAEDNDLAANIKNKSQCTLL